MDYYIYYKVSDHHSKALETAVQGLQHDLKNRLGVTACLKRRPATDTGPWTYMEVYGNAGPTFEAALDEAVTGAGLGELIQGQRHAEAFDDVIPCA